MKCEICGGKMKKSITCGKVMSEMEKRYSDNLCKKCRSGIARDNIKLNYPKGFPFR